VYKANLLKFKKFERRFGAIYKRTLNRFVNKATDFELLMENE